MTDDLVAKLRDEDSYYRLQEKHWCIDAEELERQRLAAADRIAALAAQLAEARAENARLREALGLIIENESADTGYGNSSAKIARAALGDWKPEAGDLGGDHVR